MVYEQNQSLNYQDQGTGADMIMLATEKLRKAGLMGYISNQIHDELLMIVPNTEVESVSITLEKCMIEAGNEILANYGIPTKVELSVGQHWVH